MAPPPHLAISPAAPASPLDNDDLLLQILFHLPPQPSSLPRAALVCKRWRRLITHPQFSARFRAHHRTPPFLGFFLPYSSFVPTLDPPDRVPAQRFSLDRRGDEKSMWRWQLLGCRHGLILCENTEEFLVFDPMSGDRRRIPFYAGHEVTSFVTAAVIATGQVAWTTFRLVALFTDDAGIVASVSIYSSDSGVWADSVATVILPSPIVHMHQPSTLNGHAIFWLLDDGVILQFDFEIQSLALIENPPDANVDDDFGCQIMPAEDGSFGLAVLAGPNMLFWKRELDPCDAAKWVLSRTIQLNKLLPLGKKGHNHPLGIMGIDEENNAIFLGTSVGVFMIHLESMKFTKVSQKTAMSHIYPYSSFFTAGI